MASSDGQIDKPQRGCPKRAELPGVNINTGVQSVDTERASLKQMQIIHITLFCTEEGGLHGGILCLRSLYRPRCLAMLQHDMNCL